MIKTIHKVKLSKISEQKVELPLGAKLLRVDLQKDDWTLWYEFETKNETMLEDIIIEIFGTGHLIEESTILSYLNTFFEDEFVWHVYWR